jgi:hypothetical protein
MIRYFPAKALELPFPYIPALYPRSAMEAQHGAYPSTGNNVSIGQK